MFHLDNITNENNENHNKKWAYFPDNPYEMLIIRGSELVKPKALLNLIKEKDDIDKIYFCAKSLREPKYEFLIEKHEGKGIKYLNDPGAFEEYSPSNGVVYNILMSTIWVEKEKF